MIEEKINTEVILSRMATMIDEGYDFNDVIGENYHEIMKYLEEVENE